MKNTAPSSRVVNIPARSLGLSRTGAAVTLKSTPNSCATIPARSGLSKPGRSRQKEMIKRLSSFTRCPNEDLQIILDALLPLKVGQTARA